MNSSNYRSLPTSLSFELAPLIERVRSHFILDWDGIHGLPHWERVHRHGLAIANLRVADIEVVSLFAYLHDSCRHDDSYDSLHGPRAAEFARSLNQTAFELSPKRLDLLCFAIRDHSGGEVSSNATIQTCWDSDRLDLWRVGIRPSPRYLSREAWELARERKGLAKSYHF
jgi:uncharacterized protein